MKKKLAITTGDINGIGIEIVLKSLILLKDSPIYQQIILITDFKAIDFSAKYMNLPLKFIPVSDFSSSFSYPEVPILDLNLSLTPDFGSPSKDSGLSSFLFIKKAVELRENFSAIITNPISKLALSMANIDYPGHTEMLADLTGKKNYAMLFLTPKYRVMLLTTHKSVLASIDYINSQNTLKKILLADSELKKLGISRPKLAISGINPHAGEGGLFGLEEQIKLQPAIDKARLLGIDITDPLPPDTIFSKDYDLIISCLHDHALPVIKTLYPDKSINFTIGLDFIRTSPAHGTAFDIAGKSKANPTNMLYVIEQTSQLSSVPK